MQATYLVAETIGMMVWDLEENMPVEEFYRWLGYLTYKAEEERKAAEKARKKSKH
jgi:hypothetical protein